LTEKSQIERNYVIVGAGPTGVELAGALGVYLKNIAKYHRVKQHKITIWLIEAAPRVLPTMSPRVSKATLKRLARLGVKVSLNTQVRAETLKSLKTSIGNITTHTVIWTAGTANNPFFANNSEVFNLNDRGRVVVDKHLQSSPGVYVIGDNAATKFSGTALTAIRHGNFTAKDLIARINHKHRPEKYESHPTYVVPVGKKWSVLQYRGLVLHGRIISWVRNSADFIGYIDVLGLLRAMTVWTNSEKPESNCPICRR
jgi:NADH dehydrogenase FAD-containing subunit